MFVSIAIPTYEMHGLGVQFLELSLNKIVSQTHKEFEVVVSDHSVDDNIRNLCFKFSNKIKITYIKNVENRGNSSANLNNAIRNCSGELIKILMQDEYLLKDEAIENVVKYFKENENVHWLINGCVFGTYPNNEKGRMIPFYSDKIINSINTIGSPSSLTIKNEKVEFFNESLIWVMDCDYYIRLYNKFGAPNIIKDFLVYIIQHDKQLTNMINNEIKKREEKIIYENFRTNLH